MARKPALHPLRAYRLEQHLPAVTVAKKLGIARSTLRSFENGNREIDADWAIQIERTLGIPRESLRPDLFEHA